MKTLKRNKSAKIIRFHSINKSYVCLKIFIINKVRIQLMSQKIGKIPFGTKKLNKKRLKKLIFIRIFQ